ncbi:MAG: DUF1566 domain-containing protein [Saccharospirillaceae bacterium]|nr:DUF1566 domain-containing protein [Pseudomonadales bacterium]NRB77118.1 DUF1566 domain-containing protein [Saccharospirillaceae bacterium]
MKTIILVIVTTLFASYAFSQTCSSGYTKSKPNTQYIYVGENESLVVDTQTGLMWMRCSLGQSWDGETCTGSVSKIIWQQALKSGESLNYAGFDDWRVPNIKELSSLIESACYEPAINEDIFPNTDVGDYWASTYYLGQSSGHSWYVDFEGGKTDTYGKTNDAAVRLVRLGE